MISQIKGLDQCKSLKKLFLSVNRIKKIENLDALSELEVLWLNENIIEVSRPRPPTHPRCP